MNVSDMLRNPWLIGGGVLAIVLLVAYSGGTAHGNAGGAYATGEELNLAAMKFAAEDFNTQAQVAMDAQGQNTKQTANFLSFLGQMAQVNGQVAQTYAAVNGGIMRDQITANANITVDRINANARLSQTWIGANVAMAQIEGDVRKTQIMAKASDHASNNNLFGNVANMLGGVAKAAIAA